MLARIMGATQLYQVVLAHKEFLARILVAFEDPWLLDPSGSCLGAPLLDLTYYVLLLVRRPSEGLHVLTCRVEAHKFLELAHCSSRLSLILAF
jgi:hypothetical protein